MIMEIMEMTMLFMDHQELQPLILIHRQKLSEDLEPLLNMMKKLNQSIV